MQNNARNAGLLTMILNLLFLHYLNIGCFLEESFFRYRYQNSRDCYLSFQRDTNFLLLPRAF